MTETSVPYFAGDMDPELARMKLRAKVEQIKNLPTLPQVVSRLMSMMLDDRCSASQLGQEISKDQSLTAKILKVVNSAYYGFHRQISALQDAIVILGLQEIQRLTATISVFGIMKTRGTGELFSRQAFWEHSIAVAVCSELLASIISNQIKGAFVCGLLHDIGKVVFDQFFHADWSPVVKRAFEDSLWIGVAENERFGTTHAEVACWLTERWSLPPAIVEGIRWHHEIAEPTSPVSTKLWLIVQLADRIARECQYGSGGDNQMPPAYPNIEDALQISPDQVEKLKAKLQEQMKSHLREWAFLEG